MPKFEIEVRETMAGTFFIEADSKEEAEKEFAEKWMYTSDLDLSEMEPYDTEIRAFEAGNDDLGYFEDVNEILAKYGV